MMLLIKWYIICNFEEWYLNEKEILKILFDILKELS